MIGLGGLAVGLLGGHLASSTGAGPFGLARGDGAIETAADRPYGAPIPPPDPAAEEPAADWPHRLLPAPVRPGMIPASLRYRAGAGPVLAGQARIALLVDGIGLDRDASLHAIERLPAPVSLAFSPYAENAAPLADEARRRGHELFASIPMQPDPMEADATGADATGADAAGVDAAGAGSADAVGPASDEGDMQLDPALPEAQNRHRLAWALSALPGAVGATAAEAGQSGGAALADRRLRDPVLREIRRRGLAWIDPPPGHLRLPDLVEAVADGSIPADDDAPGFVAALDAAASQAATRGSALAIIDLPGPASVDRLVAWSRTLPARGIVLVPASRLASTASPAAGPRDAALPSDGSDGSAASDDPGDAWPGPERRIASGAGGTSSSPASDASPP